jgi:hypothetical protein
MQDTCKGVLMMLEIKMRPLNEFEIGEVSGGFTLIIKNTESGKPIPGLTNLLQKEKIVPGMFKGPHAHAVL